MDRSGAQLTQLRSIKPKAKRRALFNHSSRSLFNALWMFGLCSALSIKALQGTDEAAAFTISCQLINDSNDITLAFKSILRVVLYLKYISQLFAGHAVLQLQDLKSNLGLW